MKFKPKPTKQEVINTFNHMKGTAIGQMAIKNPYIAKLADRLDLYCRVGVEEYAGPTEIISVLSEKQIIQINEKPKKQKTKIMEKEKTVYAKGLFLGAPHEKAPKFIIADLIISPNVFFEWLKENKDLLTESEKYGKQLKLQITKGDNDTMSIRVNTFVPKAKAAATDDDLPF